jgi:hypothetical protein
VPANALLLDENLRGYVVLLSAHFQGFCRDLYTEAAQVVVARVRPSLQPMMLSQLIAELRLDHGNPNANNITHDFKRFGFPPDFLTADPANLSRLAHLAALNRWRNIAAHHGTVPRGAALDLPSLRAWQASCGGLAASLDRSAYNELRRILRRAPWAP